MMFADLRSAADALEHQLSEGTGRRLIERITVDEPSGTEDELHFFKLVTWSYVLLNEAGQPVIKHLFALLRTSDPAVMEKVSRTRQNVLNLRTVRSHNLPSNVESNQHKKRQANIWLSQNGGQPVEWRACCLALCSEMIELVQALGRVWKKSCATKDDQQIAVAQLLLTIDRHWPAYLFDAFVEEATAALGINGLDIVKYREDRLEDWRQLVGFFEDNESARSGIQAAIRNELKLRFGNMPAEGSM